MNAEERAAVLREVSVERDWQDAKWGVSDHDPSFWLDLVQEEVDEAKAAAHKARVWQGHLGRQADCLQAYRTELVQVAAVAVAALECLERDAWTWGGLTVNQEDG